MYCWRCREFEGGQNIISLISQHHHTMISTLTKLIRLLNQQSQSISRTLLFAIKQQQQHAWKQTTSCRNKFKNDTLVAPMDAAWLCFSIRWCPGTESLCQFFICLVMHTSLQGSGRYKISQKQIWLAILFASCLAIPIYIIHFFSINSSYIV